MSKFARALRDPEDDPLRAAGQRARLMRASLAESFLTCEAITQQMRAIRAGLVLPDRSALFLEAPPVPATEKAEPEPLTQPPTGKTSSQ